MDISESLQQILDCQEILGKSFYEVFLNRYPEVQAYFEGVNMERQGVLLTMALIVVEQYYSNPYLATEKYLQYLGTKHHDRAIPQDLYPKWTEAMIETLKRFHGENWDSRLERQWREAIGRTTELMFEGYEKRFSV